MVFFTSLLCFLLVGATPAHAKLQQADKVVVLKSQRRMILLRNGQSLKTYQVALGRQPLGPKCHLGDCRTPEGTYFLDRRNENSRFYRSIHISYPNRADLARARKNRINPGSAIMIHGLAKGFEDLSTAHTAVNWTKGCIAVSNAEMDEIWRLVPDGTPIEIKP